MFAALSLFADLQPTAKLNLHKTKAQSFRDAEGEKYEVRHPLTKAALAQLAAAYPAAIPYLRLEEQARRVVAETGERRYAEQTDHLFGELFSLFARRAVQSTPRPGGVLARAGERPRASALACLQAGQGFIVDGRHRTLKLDAPGMRLIELADGTRDRAALAQQMQPAFGSGRLDAMLDRLARLGVFDSGEGVDPA